MPAKFTDFGGHLVDGLINGIKNKWESLKSSVTGMGDSISGWFSEKLGIHSPSRVFMGFGDNIARGRHWPAADHSACSSGRAANGQ